MKFQKFVKSLGSDGIIYVRKNEERWLASGTVFMKIPEGIRSITANEILPMPDFVESVINYDSFTDPCELHKAIMPTPTGAIRDCIRIYATENALNTIAICNNDYSLIEKKDQVEMYVRVDAANETTEGKALVIKEPETLEEEAITIGVIFPTRYDEQEDK